jgi:hypothetical protein
MAPLFSKPTVGEYEEALRKASPIQVIEEMVRKDPLYRASAIKEVQVRAQWVGITTLRWMYSELKDGFEKYESIVKDLEKPKTEHIVDPLREMYERNQVKAVHEPFFKS